LDNHLCRVSSNRLSGFFSAYAQK
jgi:hypothetical protein